MRIGMGTKVAPQGVPMPGLITSELFPSSSVRRNRHIFYVYNIYRLLIAVILLVSYVLGISGLVLGSHDNALFLQLSVFYVAFNLAVSFVCLWSGLTFTRSPHFISAVILVDIFVLVLLSYASGGVSSGLAHLLVVPIAAGSILKPARMSIFFAAVGTIAVMYIELYLYFALNEDTSYYVQAGFLGITLFATALAIQILGGRLRQNELIAEQQAHRIESLQEMNYLIIQRMRTGILVVDGEGNILNANSAALKLLGYKGAHLEQLVLPAPLGEQLEAWKEDRERKPPPLRLSRSGPQVQANFAYLNPDTDGNILIFLEDYSLLTSRLQQLKLVSLGRLTASIAHEVRNPLGAISHAGQLLNESPSLSPEEQRFTEIIIHQSERVNAIIENILQLSRKKDEIPQVIELKAWLEQFVQKYTSSRGDPAGILVTVEPPELQIRVNAGQFEQLLTNLADNGLRYSLRQTGRAVLEIRAGLLHEGDSRFLDVIDEGEGIAREDEEKIFEPFFTTESSGTGLGLFICREICEANQAQIFFRRTGEGKSSFRVIFAHPDRHIM